MSTLHKVENIILKRRRESYRIGDLILEYVIDFDMLVTLCIGGSVVFG